MDEPDEQFDEPDGCPFWWHRGDQVYYACRYPAGHDGPHRTVHFEIPTVQDDWSRETVEVKS